MPVARRNRGRYRGERGSVGIEFALAMPAVLILIFVLAEMTGVMRTWVTMENASREGARMAAVQVTPNVGDVTARTVAKTGNRIASGDVAVAYPSGENRVVVTITHTYRYGTPLASLVRGFSGGTISTTLPLQVSTSMRLEPPR